MEIRTFLCATAHRTFDLLSSRSHVGKTMVAVITPLLFLTGCISTPEQQADTGIHAENHSQTPPNNEASQAGSDLDEQAGYTFDSWRRDKMGDKADQEVGGDGLRLDAESSVEDG